MHLLETGRAILLATCVAIIFQDRLITLEEKLLTPDVIFLSEIMIDPYSSETFLFLLDMIASNHNQPS